MSDSVDYFNIPKTEWLETLALIELLPRFHRRGLHPSAAVDAAKRAVAAGRVRVGGVKSSHELSVFDADHWISELEDDPSAAHILTPIKATASASATSKTKHPALGPNDPVPNSKEWFEVPVLRRLDLANVMADYDRQLAEKAAGRGLGDAQ